MDKWKSTTNEIQSSCGFCPSKFTTWQQRADHLAAHFRNGADMSMWSNGWGFEPYVERLVENAIPPYLIGHEKNSMEPYVARAQRTPSCTTDAGLTTGTSADSTEPDQLTKDSNCWGRLEQELVKFVLRCRGAGTVPTDKDIQDQARMIIYEDNDPWNWTAADNQEWLDTFKYQNGIGTFTDSMVTPALAEVPIMAPYVIKGGLKNKAVSGAAQQRKSVSSSSNHTPECGSLPNSAGINPTFDQSMDFDFDSIDFGNLDLGVMDEMNIEPELDGQLNMMAATTAQFSSSIPADPLFGSYDPNNLALEINTGIPVQQHKQPLNAGFMTDQDINHLTGYMSGFK